MKKIFIIGPTASGKTELAKYTYDNFNVDLISVDSAQVYQDMDIGTAKISKVEQKSYPHHLIDIRNPSEKYSVNNFKVDVDLITTKIQSTSRSPLLVGGTMMYFNALEFPLDSLPGTTKMVREMVNKELEEFGIDFLFKKLKEIDPVISLKINHKDTQRVTRALEVYYVSGRPLSSFHSGKSSPNFSKNILKLALYPSNREKLHRLIEDRTKLIMKNGLIDEVEAILKKYPLLNDSYPSMRAVGYKQVYLYLKNKINKDDLTNKIIFATRQLAKRQMTWMRKMDGLYLLDPFDKNLNLIVSDKVGLFLKN